MDKLRVSTFGRGAVHEAAVSMGIYAAEDLEVERDVTNSSKVQMQQLIDGVWHAVHTNADNVVWWNEDNGADLVIVLASESKPNQDFVVRGEISSYDDLRGKVLAVDAAESGFVTPLRVLLRQAGLDEGRDYTFLEVGATRQRIDAMRDGRAHGAMVGAGRDNTADGFRVLDSINRLYSHYAGSCATRRDWAETNQDLLVRYIRAQLRAIAALAGGDEAPPFAWDGLREMMQARQDVGFLRGPADPHRFADDTFYRRAIEGWGR
jgi:ABC-type nitrate/sulfonate/bicarbonate transport system substrate-binding protein